MYFGTVRARRPPSVYKLPSRIAKNTSWFSDLGDFGSGSAVVSNLAKTIQGAAKDLPAQIADLRSALTITTAASVAAGLGVAFLLLRTRGLRR